MYDAMIDTSTNTIVTISLNSLAFALLISLVYLDVAFICDGVMCFVLLFNNLTYSFIIHHFDILLLSYPHPHYKATVYMIKTGYNTIQHEKIDAKI